MPKGPTWLRAAALLGVVALPALWLASLSELPDFVRSNAVRVAGGVLAAGWVWSRWRLQGRPQPPRTRYLSAGVVGSLAVTGLSVLVPLLGRYSVSGWLVSGLVGGGMVALAVYAAEGSLSRRAPP